MINIQAWWEEGNGNCVLRYYKLKCIHGERIFLPFPKRLEGGFYSSTDQVIYP